MTRNEDNNLRPLDAGDAEFERLVCQVLCATGSIVPQSEAGVAFAESAIDESIVQIPTTLSMPPCGPSPRFLVEPAQSVSIAETPARENLARAAREGGAISLEIEEKMIQDRARAELDNPKRP